MGEGFGMVALEAMERARPVIAAEIGRAVKDRQFAARLEQYGADPLGNTPAEFSAMVAADTALWADTIQSLGLKF
jgi:tripartite-type tricarboxylate transporter receptor subunit TctC